MRTRVTVVDLGFGNLKSVVAAFEHLGSVCRVTSSAIDVESAETIVLPGVGSFPTAMESMRVRQIDEAIKAASERQQTALLGICLGFQMLMSSSTEHGGGAGLGLVEGVVQKFGESSPHHLAETSIGFSGVAAHPESQLFQGLGAVTDFYFVHAYRAAPQPGIPTPGFANYGEKYVASFEAEQVFGVQFHPEKSQTNGLRVLQNFLRV